MFKVEDSQSQETGQTSKPSGDAEASVNRKQTVTVSLSNLVSSSYLPLTLSRAAVGPMSNLGRGNAQFTKVTFIFCFCCFKGELGE